MGPDWEERNFCVYQVLERAKRTKKSPPCRRYYDRAIEHCMTYNFPAADKMMIQLDDCLDGRAVRGMRRKKR